MQNDFVRRRRQKKKMSTKSAKTKPPLFSLTKGFSFAGAPPSAQPFFSLEDFKRKLDNEHETISAKLSQGAQHKKEMEELRARLMEDLKVALFIFVHLRVSGSWHKRVLRESSRR